MVAGPTWTLAPGTRSVEFIADLHLAEDTPATLAALAQHLRHTDADVLLLLGDIFEVWIGDDSLDEPGSPESRACAVLVQALAQRSSPLTLGLTVGNRDFMAGARLRAALGLREVPDPSLLQAPWGDALLVAHGDAWCLDDRPYQAFRQQVRSAAWQRDFLARPLTERRAIARGLREASMARQREGGGGVESRGDLDDTAVRQALLQAGTRRLVHGHTHRPACHDLGDGLQRWVLSDWHDAPDGRSLRRGDVLRWSAAGIERRAPLSVPA